MITFRLCDLNRSWKSVGRVVVGKFASPYMRLSEQFNVIVPRLFAAFRSEQKRTLPVEIASAGSLKHTENFVVNLSLGRR